MFQKTLVAATVVAASISAQAQVSVSPVQIYGILGTGISQVKGSANTTSMVNKDRLDTAILGFKSTEDLGNGLSAQFDLQGGILSESGSVGNTTNNVLFDRQAWVGLDKKGLGSIKVGRTGVIHDSFTGVGNFGFNMLDQDSDVTGLSKKPENTVRIDTAEFGGFGIKASYSGDGSSLDSITDPIKSYGVTYKLGRASLHAIQTKSGVITNNMAGGAYKLGSVDLRGQYLTSDSGAGVKIDMIKLGVALPVGASNTLYTQFTKRTRDGSTSGDFDFYGTTLVHSLSKRTGLWAGYSKKNFKDGTADSTEYTTGIQHQF